MRQKLMFLGVLLGALTPAANAWCQLTYGPILGRGVTPDQMIVKWGTGNAADATSVAYRPKGSTGAFTTLTGTAAKDHEVVVTGLTIDSPYEYYVQSGTTKSTTYDFRTCPQPGAIMDVVFYGDSRSGTSDHQKIVAQVSAQKPDMVFESGDIEPLGTYASYLSDFFPVVKELAATRPFMATPGNHDATSNLSTNYGLVFPAPRSAGAAWTSYYAFTCGNAMFIGLDSNAYNSTTQKMFLQAKLSEAHGNNDVAHVFIWFHHSPYSPGTNHGDDPDVQAAWVPTFEAEPKVTAVFTGHDHLYARMHHGASKIAYVVSGGAGAGLYDVGTTAATLDVGKRAFNFTLVRLAGGVATGTAFDETGTKIDSFTVTQSVPGGGDSDAGVGGGVGGSGGGGGNGNTGGGGGGSNGGGGGEMPGGAASGCDVGGGHAASGGLLILMLLGGVALRRRRVG